MTVEAKISLRATLVTDPNKNIIVVVKIGDSVSNLKVLIGEQMKVHFPEVFQSLDGVRAFNITIEKDRHRQLLDTDIIDSRFQDGDAIFFEIDSTNFWLRIKFLLYYKTSFNYNSEREEDNEKLYVEGSTQMRVNKTETIKYLRK